MTPEVGVDFSGITNTFWELRERGGLFNPGNLVRLVGSGLMPQVIENMFDAKAELDAQLRTVIGDFTSGFAARMTAPVSESASSSASFEASKAVKNTRSALEREVKMLRTKLGEYLDDARTRDTLAGAIQDQAISNYEDFFDRHVSKDQTKSVASSKKGKGRGDEVWDPDTFADWTTTIFGLGSTVMEEDQRSSSPSLSRTGST